MKRTCLQMSKEENITSNECVFSVFERTFSPWWFKAILLCLSLFVVLPWHRFHVCEVCRDYFPKQLHIFNAWGYPLLPLAAHCSTCPGANLMTCVLDKSQWTMPEYAFFNPGPRDVQRPFNDPILFRLYNDPMVLCIFIAVHI